MSATRFGLHSLAKKPEARTILGKEFLRVMDGAAHLSQLAQAGPGSSGGTWTYGMMALAAMFILYVAIRPFLQRRKDPLAGSPLRMGLSQQKSLEREMQNLLVELHDMARKMQAQIDTRAAKLEALIAEADEKLATLQRAVGDAGSSRGSGTAPSVLGETGNASTFSSMRDVPSTGSMRLVVEPNIEPVDDRYAPVYALADQRLDARAIASRLGKPVGEIELILALRPAQRHDDDHDVSEPPSIASA
jgi:hypothetical protein